MQKEEKMNQHNPVKSNNIFSHLEDHAKQIEQHWASIYQNMCAVSKDYPHLDSEYFNQLNSKFQSALNCLYQDLQSPTLILATTGTTSSGKSTIVNLLCGADLMPRMAQEMSAGVVYIHHGIDNKRHLHIHQTNGALWETGQWHNLSDDEIRDKLTKVMEIFNKNKGINQPEVPYIELTYPLACFNKPELLALSNLPKSTQFKLMDLPGLRNSQDSTNSEVIENCKDALCLVAYNMEETDENRRLELVEQVLGQVKNMGGSPARMLFVLNRIDVFRKDREWERYQAEHIKKTQAEITDILNKHLPEHRDTQLTYTPLSSLPALHAQRIKTDKERLQAAIDIQKHFNSLISDEKSEDLSLYLPAKKWSDHQFHCASEEVWKNSYGAEFFVSLDKHIQNNFPVLVIPTIVKNFEKEASKAIGEVIRTCYSELNSSQEKYEQACEMLIKQNTELRQFLDQSKKILIEPFNELIDGLKKNDIDLDILLRIVAEDLTKTDIFQGKISTDKLLPLASWRKELRENSIGILQGVKQSLDSKRRDFINTQADRLSECEQQRLSMACEYYAMAVKEDNESRFDEQLSNFMVQISEVISIALKNQIRQENSRIHDTIELIMKYHLDYLKEGIESIAPEWNLEIGHYVLNDVKMPEINLSPLESEVEERTETKYETRYRDKTRTVRKWYSLFLLRHDEIYKEAYSASYEVSRKHLPDSKFIYEDSKEQLSQQLDLLVEPFYKMIHDYINDLTETVIKEQNRVLDDFMNKLEQARQGHKDNHEEVITDWQPLYDQSEQFKHLLSKLTDTRNYL